MVLWKAIVSPQKGVKWEPLGHPGRVDKREKPIKYKKAHCGQNAGKRGDPLGVKNPQGPIVKNT